MALHNPAVAQAPAAPSFEQRSKRWLRLVLFGIAALGVAVLVAWALGAFLPRWWSQRVGRQVDGSIATGIVLGLVYGFIFVALPIILLRWAFRRRRHWKVWAVCIVGALLLALPNLMTLSIVLGSGNSAHAGERTLDVRAPAFRNSSLIGAIVAVIAWGILEYMLFTRWLGRRRERKLRAQLEAQKAAAVESPAASLPPPQEAATPEPPATPPPP